jgi:hypothetical protein
MSVVAHKADLIREQCEADAMQQLVDRIKADLRPRLEAELLVAHKDNRVAAYQISELESEPIVELELESPTKHDSFTKAIRPASW